MSVSVRRQPDGSYPLGEALLMLRHDPNVALYLAPVSKPLTFKESYQWPQWDRSAPYNPKGKDGKSKGKAQRVAWHPEDPLCFGFNSTSGCPHGVDQGGSVQPGERCAKGFHLCMEPKCLQPHSLQQHTAK